MDWLTFNSKYSIFAVPTSLELGSEVDQEGGKPFPYKVMFKLAFSGKPSTLLMIGLMLALKVMFPEAGTVMFFSIRTIETETVTVS